MKKKEKTPIPKEELLPVWARLLLILGPLVLLAVAVIIFVAYNTTVYRSGVKAGEYLDFTAEPVVCGVFAVIFAILIVGAFVMQFVLAKCFFKKRPVKAGIVLNAISLVVVMYLAFAVSSVNFSAVGYRTDDYNTLTQTVESATKTIGTVEGESDRALATELLVFLKDNGVGKAVAKGNIGDADAGLRKMAETDNTGYKYKELCEFDSDLSVGGSSRTVTVYDVFVGDKLGNFLNGKDLSEREIKLDDNTPNDRNERNCNYGLNTPIRPERVVEFGFGGTVIESGGNVRSVQLSVMIDVAHGAVRFIYIVTGTK